MAQRPIKLGPRDAEAVALHALAHVAADESLLERFVALTGCGADDFRRRVEDPCFLGAVLDFVLEDGDQTVLAVAEAAGIAPEGMVAVRAMLPGAGEW
ncbi:MAG: DUF3572 family protein [Alphaproteobacteria bacterium]|nr:DUF3572 family protein [Alphaproteobacteria bacterium]